MKAWLLWITLEIYNYGMRSVKDATIVKLSKLLK